MNKKIIIIGVLILVLYFVFRKKDTPPANTGSNDMQANNNQDETTAISKTEAVRYINDIMLNGWGITSRAARIGILATIGKESNFTPKFEKGYSGTSNARIREIFPTRTKTKNDAELTAIKSNDKTFFNFVYNGRLGNSTTGNDGYIYRGSGLNQLTGRSNYEKYAKLSGIDILNQPELNNTLPVATQTMLHFFYAGWNSSSGKAKLKKAGYNYINDINDINFAVRFFCNINTGTGNDINSSKVNKAVAKATPYANTLKNIIYA